MAEGDSMETGPPQGASQTTGTDQSVVTQLVQGLVKAFDGCRVMPQTVARPGKYYGRPGDVKIQEWLREFLNYCEQCHIPSENRAGLLCSLLAGPALEEMLCHSVEVRGNLDTVMDILCRQFGAHETVQDLQRLFYERVQSDHETLMDFSRSLIRSYDKVIKAASDAEKPALEALKDKSLIRQFVSGARGAAVRLELRRQELAAPNQSFSQLRSTVLDLFEGSERTKSHQGQIREVETEALSVGHSIQKGASSPSLHQLIQEQQIMLSKMVEQQKQQFTMHQQMMQIVQGLMSTDQRMQTSNTPVPYPWDRYYSNTAPMSQRPQVARDVITCHRCGKQGHIQRFCPSNTHDKTETKRQQNGQQEN